MDLKTIRKQIGRLTELVDGWDGWDGEINALERDMALGLVRELYAELRFHKWEPAAQPETREMNGETAAQSCAIAAPLPEADAPEIPAPTAAAEDDVAAAKEAAPAEEVAEEKALAEEIAEEAVMPAPEPFVPRAQAVVTEPEPLASGAQTVVPEPEVAAEPEPVEPEPAEPEKPVIARRKVDPGVIRTLYGSESIAPKKPAKEEVRPETVAEKPRPEPAPAPAVERPVRPAAEPEVRKPRPEEPKTILAEAVGGGRQTLGETLGNGKKDMASKIAAADTSSLRASIGLNDKFLMIRDMFSGDAAAFNDAISTLDEFTDLDEAIIYIHDTYDWSADSDGVKLLVDLLERKLG